MLEFVSSWFAGLGLNPAASDVLARLSLFVPIIALAALANLVARRWVLHVAAGLIARSSVTWDDAVLKRDVLKRLAYLAPAAVVYLLAPLALSGHPELISVVNSAVEVYAIAVVVLAVDALLSAGHDIYDTLDVAKQIPIKGFVQVARLLLYFVGTLIFLSVVLDKAPLILLSGLGAFTAVLMIIFRDSILGFVAGIQLSANRMVALGDWIEMPKYQADGDVIDVSLTTVKVQNWDKTITTIPTYALITESFKNWRGMSEAKARRIKRAVTIDISSIALCNEEMLERFSQIEFISEYVDRKQEEVAQHNAKHPEAQLSVVNGRRLTNIGTFRAYVLAYLRQHPSLHQEMTMIVRQLPPSELGLPIEIYVFSKDTAWSNFEDIQADIFDHIIAVAPEFDLRVFQNPAGADLRALAAASASLRPRPNLN